MNRIILNGDDGPANAGGRLHFVAGFQIVDHHLPALLPSLLWQNQEKIKNTENEDQRQP